MAGPASVTFLCPACSRPVRARDLRPACPSCAVVIELREGGGWEANGPLARCAVCASEALHLAKDFNKNLGPLLVALGCIGFYWGALSGIVSLAVLTVIDRIVYRLRPEVTVCYACKAVYRDVTRNPRHLPYELTYDETFEGTGQKPGFRG